MKKEAIKYWNNIASKSDADARDAILSGFRSKNKFDESGRTDAQHLLLPFISDRDTILDVGCGIGRLLKWTASHCSYAIGLDISSEMLKKAKQHLFRHKNVSLKKLPRSLRFPIPTRTIDFAYFYHVSEHMDKEHAFTILEEIRKCLRRDGRALVQFSLITHPDNQREFKTWVRHGDPESVRSRFYTEEEVHSFLQMVKLYPQIRLYIPGKFAVIVTKSDSRVLGEMPLVKLYNEQK